MLLLGGHVKKFITSSFFSRITFSLAIICRRYDLIKLENYKLKFQTVAEKTAKNFRGLLFCRTLYVRLADTH